MVELNDMNTPDHNVEIEGVPFYAKEIKATEGFVRREIKRTKIKSGTEHVVRGAYIPREYSFSTWIEVPEEKPNCYNDLFVELSNKPCEVICADMGGMFNAEVNFKPTHPTGNPTRIDLEVTVKEIPELSLIPDDEVIKPETEVLLTEEDIKKKYGEK